MNAPVTPAKDADADNTQPKAASSLQDMPTDPAANTAAPPAEPDAATMEASRKIVTDTRQKLAAIDELLKETE